MKLYFTRHGESEVNVKKMFSNKDSSGGLTEKGREQAAALGESIKDIKFEKFYSSPICRAKETSEIIERYINIQPDFTDALREYNVGILEETSKIENGGWGNLKNMQEEEQWWRYQNFDFKIEGGESYNDIKKRFLPFFDETTAAYKKNNVNLFFVAHGGLYKCMMPLIFDNIDLQFSFHNEFKNCELIIGEYRNGKMICTDWGKKKIT